MNKHTRSVSLIDGRIEVMTDAEIKKALEWHLNSETNCDECPYKELKKTKGNCVGKMLEDALDLIKRQQAEIEKLNVELVGMRGACESYKMHYDNAQAEIERLERILDKRCDVCPSVTTAIKELAERLCEGRVSNDTELKMTEVKEN